MSIFAPPPKPTSPLAWHRPLSPTASVKISPLCLGGISLGSSWSGTFGTNDDAFALLDAFYALGGNFIDTSNTYNSEESERLIGRWMEARGVRDQIVVATKYAAGYKAYDREGVKVQSNYTGGSAKAMYVSLKDSLEKLKTSYIDVLYCHWWDPSTSAEELMTHLHSYIMSHQVLYLGASDMPAWYVVKCNAYARAHGLTPFSLYQGRWNAAFRDMEAELIPMCEDQGMAIVPWAALGGGQLLSTEQREARDRDPNARKGRYGPSADDDAVCEVLEKIAKERKTSLQAVALAYLLAQSTYVVPIVGVNTVEHVKAMPEALKIRLTTDEVREIQAAKDFTPLFPQNFIFNFLGGQSYTTGMGVGQSQQHQMAAWVDSPRDGVWPIHGDEE